MANWPLTFTFDNFASPQCPSVLPNADFNEVVADQFLERCAQEQDYMLNSMRIWKINLHHDSGLVPLFIVKEKPQNQNHIQCHHCQSNGWTETIHCNYHFIIPEDSSWTRERLPDNVLYITSHILHGVSHCNKTGHLLCINGYLGGAEFLQGKHVMKLWNRICINLLQPQQISLVDSSTKLNMELRLLHAILEQRTWFGQWGYYCAKDEEFSSLANTIGSQSLGHVLIDVSDNVRQSVYEIAGHYEVHELATLGDIFRKVNRECIPGVDAAGDDRQPYQDLSFLYDRLLVNHPNQEKKALSERLLRLVNFIKRFE